ncbi:hypothetical protein [Enterovirga aerilata]|uniref:Uncharacterized protein n=1 Tax=Enterovirga aerilata TaxID=2730920 RepID=A0A849I532_9HYPH|nr:hypothetical protein [Enterovirga sp. DB1703]NNM71499.1 hypothetical protein [Enterovirga sp. DB1703]
MTAFNPGDWRSSLRLFRGPHDRRRPEERNRETVHRWAMIVAFCTCFASLAPPGTFPAALAALLLVAGFASLALAFLQGQSPFAPHLTGFDEAAWSFLASLALGFGLSLPAG